MSETKKPKAMPKGGRKGGASFPRINLESAVGYARRLVSKTHTGPQPKDIIYIGVLGSKGSASNAKISALKQYGFTEGDTENGFSASEHAKQLVAAPPNEQIPHYRAAVLRPKIFKSLFDTYHGDSVTHAKLKQRAAALKVHPDETETCVNLYLQSAQLAGLVTPEGDSFRHIADADLRAASKQEDKTEIDSVGADEAARPDAEDPEGSGKLRSDGEAKAAEATPEGPAENGDRSSSPRAIFNVNVTLDSSLDTEKLQKQLEILKKYGAI